MADAQEIKRAQDTYATLCEFLTTDQWPFQKKDDELLIETSARGNDLPMPILVKVRTDRQLVLLLSTLPFDVPADKRLEIAAAASIVNYRLVNGTFEFNISTGKLYFRMANSFIDTTLDPEIFKYMLYCSCRTVDDYNDKFEALIKGEIGLDAFME